MDGPTELRRNLSGHFWGTSFLNIVWANTSRQIPSIKSLSAVLIFVVIATAINYLIYDSLQKNSISLIFLISVLLSSVFFGFWTGIIASIISFLAFNFFFVEPFQTFRVSRVEDFIALAVFILVAGLTGTLAGRLREQATSAQERARLLENLFGLSNALGESTNEDEAKLALIRSLYLLTGKKALIIERDLISSPPLKLEDMEAAERALRHGTFQRAAASGWGAGQLSFYPVVVDHSAPLVVGMDGAISSVELERAAKSAIEQSGAVIARLRSARDADQARMKADRESLRSAVLSSLSHDLKTPLATILGSVTTLREFSNTLPQAARDDLLHAIEEDARRLNIYVGDLLHMTRLNAGVEPKLEWVAPNDVLNGAANRLRRVHKGCNIEVRADDMLPLLKTDSALLEQALFNCMDNAAIFTPNGSQITASLQLQQSTLLFSIEDDGSGVPEIDQERIFEPFQRGAPATSNGTGLGLAIARGIVQALGGSIGVDSPIKGRGGARFWISVPIVEDIAA